MRAFSIVQNDDTDTKTDLLADKQVYMPESAEVKRRAIKLGSVVFSFLVYGALCAEFGLPAATLLAGGIACVLLPFAILALRKKHLWEPFYNKRILGIELPEIEPEFAAEFQFILMRETLQLMVVNPIPHFFNVKFVRVKFDQVPNGVLYEVAKHTWSGKKEYIELRLSDAETLAKAWDKKLRSAILRGRDFKPEILIHYQE